MEYIEHALSASRNGMEDCLHFRGTALKDREP